MLTSWERRRSAFSHDWFSKLYLVPLGKWLNVLEGAVDDHAFERAYLGTKFREWEAHREEILGLPIGFLTEMTPMVTLVSEPLESLGTRTRNWLGLLVHALWCARNDVSRQVERARVLAFEADRQYAAIKQALSKYPANARAADLQALSPMFVDFLRVCSAYLEALRVLPREIRAV